MNQRCLANGFGKTRALLLILLVAALAPWARAEGDDQDDYMGENPARYAQVKVVEGEVQIRKGEVEEALDRGTPIAEGDVVESQGRGVLQLADGSRLAFGGSTRFQVAALFMDKDSEQQVLIRLDYGRIRATLGADSNAQLRVDTPSGSGILGDRCSASFEVTQDRTTRVRVHTGRLAFSNDDNRATILAGERLTVYSSHDQLDRVRNFNTYDFDDFDSWCDRYLNTKHGESFTRVPQEIRYYADDLDGAGQWIYVDDCASWCWRPMGIADDWRPYYDGRWGCYPGGMTWISYQPWGYLTHHYGRWGWRASWGWYWIPGIYYSPAWVAWHSNDAYFGWAPLGYYNDPCSWGHRGWGGGHCWNVVSMNYVNVRNIHNHIYNDPGTIQRFNPGLSGPGWLDSRGHRPLNPGWQRGPLMVNPREFHNPNLLQHAMVDQAGMRDRFQNYERQARNTTGRNIYHRDVEMPRPLAPNGFSTSPAPVTRAIPFEDRTRLRPIGTRPVPPLSGGVVPPQRSNSRPATDPQVNRYTQRPQENGGVVPPRSQGRPSNGSVDQAPRRDLDRERPRPTERPQPAREVPRAEPPRPPVRETPRSDSPRPMRETPRSESPRPERSEGGRGSDRPASPSSSRPAERPSSPAPSSHSAPAPSSSQTNSSSSRSNNNNGSTRR